MCIGARSQPIQQAPTFRDAPPVVTGSQTGVDNPKDTKKATEQLKIKRQKREGTYVDPNLETVENLLNTSSRMSQSDRARRTANQKKAKTNFQNRRFSSYKRSVKKAGSSNVA